MKQPLVDHLGNNISALFSFPFTVYYFKPFPDDLYPLILKNLPDDESYEYLPHQDAMRDDGSSTRTVLSFDDLSTPFWRELSSILCGPEVEEIFRKHVGFDGRVRAVCRLFRDFAGYKISPHPDSSKKACTVQMYLPADDTQSDLGTSFYYRNADFSFTEAHKLPFMPNTAYCFKVTDKSWHGTNFKEIKKPRNSLILTYYKA